ncbi:MAG: HD domain-containing protein [Spirochaetaceae bacterium]|jgi:HD superfamily phosphohydrolase|nr:HD domain-containing protein [Spirochaetaceae bacterium]
MSKVIDRLLSGFTEPRRDMLWGHIYLTPELDAISQSEPFMKLHRILQLGPAYLCYPGASHTRAAHSFGVYHLTRRILLHLAEEGADSFLSEEGVMAMLCAALLHDAGHFPYAHSLKELPLAEHETLSARLVQKEPLKSLIGKTGADPVFTAAIIDIQNEYGQTDEGNELAFYRKILSGALDPDKLDYLNRDARCCGVPYGAQDVDYVISMLHPHKTEGIQIDSRGIPSVESILFSKYLMYRSVYWHHRVRCATAMVKKAVYLGLRDGVFACENLYGLDDAGLFALLAPDKHPAFALAQKAREGRLFQLPRGNIQSEARFSAARHGACVNIEQRAEEEARIAALYSQQTGRKIGELQVVIDIPEEVIFETGLHVIDENCSFNNSSSVFRDSITSSFAGSLRMVRVYIEDFAS